MDLVADIGGTNTRIALSDGGQPLADSQRSFRNDAFAGFDAVLAAYLDAANAPELNAVCVAVAGPVGEDSASLTNRDWHFDSAGIAQTTGAGRVVLMNDLAALGYALPHLAPEQLARLRPGQAGARRNGQAFVLGLGTGVNLSVAMRATDGGFGVLEAEAGHVALPHGVHVMLEAEVGAVDGLDTVEELFAGRGLAALHAAVSGQAAIPAHEVIVSTDPAAQKTIDLFSRLLGMTLRELILSYLPLDGVYLAGGVARGVLDRAPRPFADALNQPHRMGAIIAAPPIRLICDDAAALRGCAARLALD